MALVKGTNCGFVTATPSGDPGGTGLPCDGDAFALRDTSPAGSNAITEIGFYQGGSSNDAAAYNVGIYEDDGGVPGSLIATQESGQATTASTAGWYQYTGLSIPIGASTTYWIAFSMEPVSQSNWTDYAYAAGETYKFEDTESETLSDPFSVDGGPSNMLISIYAKYEELVPSESPSTSPSSSSSSSPSSSASNSPSSSASSSPSSSASESPSTSPSAPAFDAILKRWDGGAWVQAKLMTWNAGWNNKPMFFWDGANWLTIDNT